jgi:uncharacterized membrane protein YdjX (TVP38/TMEM64 family)
MKPESTRDRLVDRAYWIVARVQKAYRRMTPLQRVLSGILILILLVGAILILVYNESILRWLEPIAEQWRSIPGGWLILWAITFVSCIPPVIGYSTFLMLGGFVWGLPNGSVCSPRAFAFGD